MTDPKPAMTVGEIMERFHVSRATVHSWLASGKLPSYRLPGKCTEPIIRVKTVDVDRFALKYEVTA